MLAVLTRTPDRRFSEIDIACRSRTSWASPSQALETSLELRESEPAPERDPASGPVRPPGVPRASRPRDRSSPRSAGALRPPSARRRSADHDQRADRPPRRGRRPRGGRARAERRGRPSDLPCRIGGGRFAVVLRRPTAAMPRGSRSAPGRATGAAAPGNRGRLVLGRRRRVAFEGRRDGARHACRCRARAREELRSRHGGHGREAAGAPVA